MRKRRWYLDAALIILVISMAVLLYIRVERFLKYRQVEDIPVTLTDTPAAEPSLQAEESEVETTQAPPKIIAPDFSLITLEGSEGALSDHLGKAVLVNFWATWCPPCRAEMPLIQEFADLYGDDLVVLAVNVGESEGEIRAFVEEYGFTLTFLVDPANEVSQLYRVRGYPTSIFIDSEGMVKAVHIGELDKPLISEYLATIGLSE